MKNTKQNARKKENQSMQQLRASALRALNSSALKTVKGGEGGSPLPPSSDPIC